MCKISIVILIPPLLAFSTARSAVLSRLQVHCLKNYGRGGNATLNYIACSSSSSRSRPLLLDWNNANIQIHDFLPNCVAFLFVISVNQSRDLNDPLTKCNCAQEGGRLLVSSSGQRWLWWIRCSRDMARSICCRYQDLNILYRNYLRLIWNWQILNNRI